MSPGEPGLKAFHAGKYGEAILLWSELGPEHSPALRAALAEAYFRRGLTARPPLADPVADLRRAVELLPDEARFWYQLGLALHRADHLEEARQAYSRSAELGLMRQGNGFAQGLAALETEPGHSLDTLPWLSPDARVALAPISALLRGELQRVPGQADAAGASSSSAPTAALWKGLALLAGGEADRASAALAPPPAGQRLPIGAEAVRAYYYGLATALSGKTQAALAAWAEMMRPGSQANSASPPHWKAAPSRLYARNIIELQQAGQWEEAFAQAQAALRLVPGDPWLLQASLIAANRLAEKARETGDWATAAMKWQTMRAILETHPELGPLPPILHNLAIACEAFEEWEDAAKAWAALLGTLQRRGRAAKKPAPDAGGISPEEKRAWLRRRILENYTRAELPDEAIAYYKQAVKADPEDLDLRMGLASALFANEQEIAARNEIQRILTRDPKHIPAFLLQAELHEERGEEDAAEQSLRRILEIDPKHDTALRGIGKMLRDRGVDAFNHGQYPQARQIYTEALKYAPGDPQLLVFLGETEMVLGRAKVGLAHFETALATGKPEAYLQVFTQWARQKEENEARLILERARAAGVALPLFLMSLGVICLTRVAPVNPSVSGRRPAASQQLNVWEAWGRELIQEGLEVSSDRADALKHLLGILMPDNIKLALEYARQLAALKPDEPEVTMTLGLFQALSGDTGGARTTLILAERAARKLGRTELLDEILTLRGEINSPLFGMMGSFFGRGGPRFDPDEDYF